MKWMRILVIGIYALTTIYFTYGKHVNSGNDPGPPDILDINEGIEDDPDKLRGLSRAEFNQMANAVRKIKVLIAKANGVRISEADIKSTLLGDIAVTAEQALDLLEQVQNRGRSKRFAASGYTLWSGIIHYEISPIFGVDDVERIQKEMNRWAAMTCINVQYHKDYSNNNDLRLRFVDGGGCWSYLGRIKSSGYQEISVAPGGCTDWRGIIAHEIGHALTLMHTQCRTDRDSYVDINFNVIDPNYQSNFRYVTGNLFDMPYDYGSVMHYRSTSFATSGKSISSKGPYAKYDDYSMGQRDRPSFMDYKSVNLQYSCQNQCPTSITCERGGIPDTKASCSSCLCPEGFGGNTCNDVVGQGGCAASSGVRTATSSEQCVETPGYPTGYSIGDECGWLIQAPEGRTIDVYFKDTFGIAYAGYYLCFHWVEITASAKMEDRGPRFCAFYPDFTSSNPITSQTNEALIHFSAQYPDVTRRAGARICYKLTSGGPDCASNLCQNGASCADDVDGSYTCTCAPGYLGSNCQEADNCYPNPCQNSASCTDGDNTYTCSCAGDYYGTNCENYDECSSSPCQNGGSCTDGESTFSCTCVTGYDSADCSNNIDDCSSNQCQNGGSCVDDVNTYTCNCTPGFSGTDCSDEDNCFVNPCQNSGSCTDGDNTYTCSCAANYYGTNCENFDECFSGPCQNGGSCTDGEGTFSCTCVTGYDGADCSTNIDDCSSNLCQNGGSCVDGVNTYTCNCAPGFSGSDCSDEDNCFVNPCQNSGSCTDGDNTYTCSCAANYYGTNCENFDECSNGPCQNGGSCTDGEGAFSCTCPNGYDGADCSNNIDDCSPNPCENGGSCVDGVNTYTCNCATGWLGTTCSDADPCAPNPCLNEGSCSKSGGSYTCTCANGYSGTTCNVVNQCITTTPCLNGGTCNYRGDGSYTCACRKQWTGTNCETKQKGGKPGRGRK